jgi:hypothetical protein
MSSAAFDTPYPLARERFPTIRQSLLSSFDDCALSSYFDTAYRRGWSHPWHARGRMFHAFAGEALREMARLGEEKIPTDAALSILRDLLRQDWADRRCPRCGVEEILPGIDELTGERTCGNGHRFETELVNLPAAAAKDLAWVTIKWAHDNTFDIRHLVDVEQRLEATAHYPHPGGGSVSRVLSGQLDALFVVDDLSHAIVLDWKDTWGLPAEHDEGDDEVSFKGYFQQRFYAWLIFKNYAGVDKVTLREFYVRFSATREASLERDELPELESEFAALAERFDRVWDEHLAMGEDTNAGRRPFRPTPGKCCNWCTRPSACPIPQFARGDGRIIDADAAALFGRQVLAAEATLKQGRKALRAFTDVNGPIAVKDAKGTREMGYRETVRVERPSLEDLERAERERGRPLTSVEVRGLYKRRRITRFGSHTPRAVDEGAAQAELERQLKESILQAQVRAGAAGENPLLEDDPPDNVVPLDRNVRHTP